MRPNAPPKSCTGCCTSSPSSSPWWVSSRHGPALLPPPLLTWGRRCFTVQSPLPTPPPHSRQGHWVLAATEPVLEPRSPGGSGFPWVTAPPPSPSAQSSRDPHLRPGLVAVFDYHRKEGYADLYSLHSWCGILVFVLFFVQVSPCRPMALGRGGEQGRGQACAQAKGAPARRALPPTRRPSGRQARGFGPRSHLGAHSVGLGPASSAGRPSPRAQRSRRRSGRRPPRGGVAGPAVLEGGGPPGASLGSSLQRSSASGSTSPFLPVARGL